MDRGKVIHATLVSQRVFLSGNYGSFTVQALLKSCFRAGDQLVRFIEDVPFNQTVRLKGGRVAH